MSNSLELSVIFKELVFKKKTLELQEPDFSISLGFPQWL